MTRTSPFRTATAVGALLFLAVVIGSPTVVANTFRQSDADPFYELLRGAIALSKDMHDAVGILGGNREFTEAWCLYEVQIALASITESLSSTSDLVILSAQMKDGMDELTINVKLATIAAANMKSLAADRRFALQEAALCSTSALVNTYAQKTATIADRATVLFRTINSRVGSLWHPS
jgi:hypothetical protein